MGIAFPETVTSPGSSHAVLLLHGLNSAPIEMRYVARVLHKAGFTTVCPALKGYTMGSACTTREQWITDLVAQYDALVKTHESVSVVGLSIGASLCLALAQARPQVNCVVAQSTTLDYDGWSIPWYNFLLEPCYVLGLARGYSYAEESPFGLKNEALRQRVAQAMQANQHSMVGAASIPIDFLFHAHQLGRAVRKNLHRIVADTLVIHAIDDETASPRNAHWVYDGISSVHKRKIFLGDSYHIICMDNERELVASETARFILASLSRQGLLALNDAQLPNTSRALTRAARRAAT
jgi:carboxylesterase